MRLLMLLAGWFFVTRAPSFPDDLTGTYALQTQRGRWSRIEVTDGRSPGPWTPGTIALGATLGRYARGVSPVDAGELRLDRRG
jgi:hypothetical protein